MLSVARRNKSCQRPLPALCRPLKNLYCESGHWNPGQCNSDSFSGLDADTLCDAGLFKIPAMLEPWLLASLSDLGLLDLTRSGTTLSLESKLNLTALPVSAIPVSSAQPGRVPRYFLSRRRQASLPTTAFDETRQL